MATKNKTQKKGGIKILDLTQDSLKNLSNNEMRVIGGCLPNLVELAKALVRKVTSPEVLSCGKTGDQCTCLQVWQPKWSLWSGTTLTIDNS